MYCPECGAEYRPEIQVCAHCNLALVETPPSAKPWTAEEAGWRVVVAGEAAKDLEEASLRLESGGVPHMVLSRREDGTYLPPGAEGTDEVRPMLLDEWTEPWLLVVPRPRFSLASHLLKATEKEERIREEMERQEEEAESREPEEPDYSLPWEKGGAPLSGERKAVAFILSAVIGMGSGLFLLRRRGQAFLCLVAQLAYLSPSMFGDPSQALPLGGFILLRAIDFVLVARAAIKG